MESNRSNACANKAIKKWKDRKHIRSISECDDSKIRILLHNFSNRILKKYINIKYDEENNCSNKS